MWSFEIFFYFEFLNYDLILNKNDWVAFLYIKRETSGINRLPYINHLFKRNYFSVTLYYNWEVYYYIGTFHRFTVAVWIGMKLCELILYLYSSYEGKAQPWR